MPGGRFWLRLDVGSRQWGGTSWDLDLDIGRFNDVLGAARRADRLVDQPAAARAADPQAAYDAKIAEARVNVLKVARRRTVPFQKTAFLRKVSGSDAVKIAAFDELVEDGSLVQAGTTGSRETPLYRIAP